MAVDPATTWWLVSTRPSAESTMPVPAPCAPSYPMVVLTSTSPCETAAAVADCSGVNVSCCGAALGGVPGTTPGGALGLVVGGAVVGGAVVGGAVGLLGVGRAGVLGAVTDGVGGAAVVEPVENSVVASAAAPTSSTRASTAASTAAPRRRVGGGSAGDHGSSGGAASGCRA